MVCFQAPSLLQGKVWVPVKNKSGYHKSSKTNRHQALKHLRQTTYGGLQCLVGLVINFLWTTSKNGVSVKFTQECEILNTLKVCSYLVLYCHTGAVFALISSVVLPTNPNPRTSMLVIFHSLPSIHTQASMAHTTIK